MFFFHSFHTYFSFQIVQFLLRGAQEYFLPQGAGHPSYATAYTVLENDLKESWNLIFQLLWQPWVIS